MRSTLLGFAILSLLSGVSGAQDRSTAFQRYAASDLEFELENTFFPRFNHKLITGLGYNADPAQDPLVRKKVAVYRNDPQTLYLVRLHYQHREMQAAYHLRHALDGFVENTTFRDPTSPILVGDRYHIWYSKSACEFPASHFRATALSCKEQRTPRLI